MGLKSYPVLICYNQETELISVTSHLHVLLISDSGGSLIRGEDLDHDEVLDFLWVDLSFIWSEAQHVMMLKEAGNGFYLSALPADPYALHSAQLSVQKLLSLL